MNRMNRYMFKNIVEANQKKILELIDKKNQDYASADDIFANFKRMATISKVMDLDVRGDPGAVIMYHCLQKLDRLWNIYKNIKEQRLQPANEGIEDTIIDEYVYSNLLAGWMKELISKFYKEGTK